MEKRKKQRRWKIRKARRMRKTRKMGYGRNEENGRRRRMQKMGEGGVEEEEAFGGQVQLANPSANNLTLSPYTS